MAKLKDINQLTKQQLINELALQSKQIKQLQNHILSIEKKNSTNGAYDILPLRELIAVLPGNIFWKNSDGIYLGSNINHAKIVGYDSPKDIIGKNSRDILGDLHGQQIDLVDQEIMRSKKGRFLEEPGYDADGKPAIYFSHKIPLFNPSGKLLGLVGMSLDITEQKRIEKELQVAKEHAEASDQAKSKILAVVNHELRTPLASISGLTNFLIRGNLSEQEEKKIVRSINDACKHLLSIVNDVLDFSKLATGAYKLKLQTICLNNLVGDINNLLMGSAENKKLTLKISIDPNAPSHIITDKNILTQILINLIGNAIKFTEKGSVSTEINFLGEKNNKAKLQFIISDTGIGIPKNKIKHIFEPFHQLEDAYARQSSRRGTGLGLSIVKSFLELLHLKIHVTSKVGQGSKFSFCGEFPIATIDDTIVKKSFKKPIEVLKIFPDILPVAPKIMLIEDDPTIQFVHKKMLEDLGCKVDVFARGKEAIAALNDHALVFVDISLPDMSGFDVIRAIRKQKNRKKLPLVALTVYTGETEKKFSIEAGASAFANKPISLGKLKKILLRYLLPKKVLPKKVAEKTE